MFLDVSLLRSDPTAWMRWPRNEHYCLQFLRVLGASQDGGSTITECCQTANRITPGDDESWHREWKMIADINKERGDLALADGNICTAQNNWLRAANYYRAAAAFLGDDDLRHPTLADNLRSCSHHYLAQLQPAGEIVRIPYREDGYVPGYFLRAPSSGARTPVVICFGGPASCKEEHLSTMPRHALARGLSLLLVDLPGQGAIPQKRNIGRHDIEISISHCVDYLIARGDVDAQRIAIYGDGLGAAFASRAAALDHRFAAAVCDGGIWDLRERAFLLGWLSDDGEADDVRAQLRKLSRFGIARRIRCPMLVALSEQDPAHAGETAELIDIYRDAGLDIRVRSFTGHEGAALPGQSVNPAIDNDFIYDWIAARLANRPA